MCSRIAVSNKEELKHPLVFCSLRQVTLHGVKSKHLN